MNSEKTRDGDVLMKLLKEWRKRPLMDVQKAWSANSHQLGKLKELMKEAGVLRNYNSKCKNKLSTDASRRVSVRLSYTSVVKVGDQWLICHTHQEKQCQHVQIEKAALALVHKCKISHLYLCVANVS